MTGHYTVLFAVPRVMMVRPTRGRQVEWTASQGFYEVLDIQGRNDMSVAQQLSRLANMNRQQILNFL